jgi:myo-inositol-1(or 4)-monophosphatase
MPRTSAPSTALLRRLLRTARGAVGAAAAAARRARRGSRPIAARRKGEGDFVTLADVRIEQRLRRALLGAHPGHGFVGEETGAQSPGAEFVWLVDPIDGTSNFARGLPHYGIAAACLWRGRPIAAAVHCQPDDALYAAAAGLGAWCGRRRLRIAPAPLDDRAIIGAQWLRGPHELRFLASLTATGARVRTLGSTVVQLCDVAAGRLDANVQEQGRIWDLAAAALIVMEAGGRVTSWQGRDIFPIEDPCSPAHFPSIAAPPRVHRRLVAVLAR